MKPKMELKTTRAEHDLNNVKLLKIRGWGGAHKVTVVRHKGRDSSRGPRVVVEGPQRHDGEFWTYNRVNSKGEMTCFSDLLGESKYTGAKDPTTNRPWPLLVITLQLPKDHPGVKVDVKER